MNSFRRNGIRGHKLSFFELHITYPIKCFFNQGVSIKTCFWVIAIVIFVGTGMGFRSLFPWLSEASMPIEVKAAETPKTIAEYVISEVRKADIPVDKTVLLVACESGWNTEAMLVNKGGSLGVDLGLFQINTKFHPEVSKSCSLDYRCATQEFIRIYKKSRFKEWTCSKKLGL